MIARLLTRTEPELQAFREAASRRVEAHARLELLHPTLDLAGGMLHTTLEGHHHAVTGLAVDAGFRRLASVALDGEVRIWDTQDGQLKHVLRQNRVGLGNRGIGMSADGRLVAAGSANFGIFVWDTESGTPLNAPAHDLNVTTRTVAMFALSEDGKHAAYADRRDPAIYVWDVGAHRDVCRLAGHRDAVTSVAISAAGGIAASGSDDCTIRIWNIAERICTCVLSGHKGTVTSIALSRNAELAISGSSDRTVRVWHLPSGACLRTLAAHPHGITAVGLSGDCVRAITADFDRNVHLWSLATGTLLTALIGHSDAVRAVALDVTGARAATASADGTVKIWNLPESDFQATGEVHQGAVSTVVFSADGQWCASGGNDGRIQVRRLASGRLTEVIEAHTPLPVQSLAFTSDSAFILSVGLDRKHWMFNLTDHTRVSVPVYESAPVQDSALSSAVRYFVAACSDRYVYIWDMPSAAPVARIGTRRLFDHLIPASRKQSSPTTPQDQHEDPLDVYAPGEPRFTVHEVWIAGDGERALFSATVDFLDNHDPRSSIDLGLQLDGAACLLQFHISSGAVDTIVISQTDPLRAFAANGPGTQALLARQDHSLELWDVKHEKRRLIMRGHTDSVAAVCITPDTKQGISVGRDRTLRVWDLRTGAISAIFTADAALNAVALAPDGRTVAAGDAAGRVHLLRLLGELPQPSEVRSLNETAVSIGR